MRDSVPAMRFYADLHIHSKYSRACSQDLDLPGIARSALWHGLTVVGTMASPTLLETALSQRALSRMANRNWGLAMLQPCLDSRATVCCPLAA